MAAYHDALQARVGLGFRHEIAGCPGPVCPCRQRGCTFSLQTCQPVAAPISSDAKSFQYYRSLISTALPRQSHRAGNLGRKGGTSSNKVYTCRVLNGEMVILDLSEDQLQKLRHHLVSLGRTRVPLGPRANQWPGAHRSKQSLQRRYRQQRKCIHCGVQDSPSLY